MVIHFRIGGLHSSNVYIACIEANIICSEISQLWIEARDSYSGRSKKIIQGRDYKAGLRIQRITWQAAWRIILPQFILYLQESHNDLFIDIIISATANTKDSSQTLLTHINTPEFFNIMDESLSIKKKDKNFAYILIYMDILQVLLAFTWAQRFDDFKLHSHVCLDPSCSKYDITCYCKCPQFLLLFFFLFFPFFYQCSLTSLLCVISTFYFILAEVFDMSKIELEKK